MKCISRSISSLANAGLLLLACYAQPAATGACLAVEGDRILGKHLAAADSQLSALPPDQVFGFIPQPGATRTISAAELMRWAHRLGITLSAPAPVCLTAQTTALDPAALTAALQKTLHAGPETVVTIVDYSRWPVAIGAIEFPAIFSAPHSGGIDTYLIRGVVRYGRRLTQPIWVRARVEANQAVVVATEALPAGKRIEARSLRLEQYRGYPLGPNVVTRIEDAVNHAPRQTVRPGARLAQSNLTAPAAVDKGEMVEVAVISGAARIKFSATAQTSAREGERILLENPATRHRFQARLLASRRAEVTVAAGREERK